MDVKQLEKAIKAEKDEKEKIKLILKYFPKNRKFGKEIYEYLNKEVFKDNYIFMDNQHKGFCSVCHKEFPIIDKWSKYQRVSCPKCGSEANAFKTWVGKRTEKIIEYAYFHYFEKSPIDDQTILCRGIYASKDYTDYKKPVIKCTEKTLYVFSSAGKSHMLMHGLWWGARVDDLYISNKIRPTLEYISHCHSYFFFDVNSLFAAFKGTRYQYFDWSKHKKAAGTDGYVKMLDLVCRYRSCEYLQKMGLHELLEERISGYGTYGAINLGGKSIYDVFRMKHITKEDIKIISSEYWLCRPIKIMQIFAAKGEYIDANFALKLKDIDMQDLKNLSQYASAQQILNYNEKIKNRKPRKITSSNGDKCYDHSYINLHTWVDYIKDCEKLNYDLSDKTILFPRDLYKAHQSTIEKIRYEADKQLNLKIKKRFNSLRKKLSYEDDEYIIRPASSSQEIVQEGSSLHHCVGSYVNRYAEGRTNILVLRKKEEPNKPFYTIEVTPDFDKKDALRFAQIRGLNNCSPLEEMVPFVDAYKQKIERMAGGM
ncbi:MAG: PcfJ domain-containing protein [Acidaminococcaceae bacterium]